MSGVHFGVLQHFEENGISTDEISLGRRTELVVRRQDRELPRGRGILHANPKSDLVNRGIHPYRLGQWITV